MEIRRGQKVSFGQKETTRITAIAVGVVILGGSLWYQSIRSGQEAREQETLEQQYLMHEFESAIGYDGLIHNFKNWILRPGETHYRERAEEKAAIALALLDDLEESLTGFGPQLDDAREAVETYQSELAKIDTLRQQGLSIQEIDAELRFDDTNAAIALEHLRAVVDESTRGEIANRQRQERLLTAIALTAVATLIMLAGMLHRARRKASLAVARHSDDMEAFTRIVAHDLKGPLNQIARLVEFIREDREENGPDVPIEQHLSRIEDRVTRLSGRIHCVFDYLRAGTSNDPLELVDLDALVRDVGEALLPDQVELQIDEPLGTVLGREAELETIVGNLLSNAVKHHPEGTPSISLRVAEVHGRQVLHVADDGPGIPAEERPHVFDMYCSLDKADDPTSGVGLAMVRRIVNSWGGDVTIGGVAPHGADFAVSLPDS